MRTLEATVLGVTNALARAVASALTAAGFLLVPVTMGTPRSVALLKKVENASAIRLPATMLLAGFWSSMLFRSCSNFETPVMRGMGLYLVWAVYVGGLYK